MIALAACANAVSVADQSAAVEFVKMEGLMAAAFTPFNSTDVRQVNYNAVEGQAKWLAQTGVMHVLVAGTTGESVKLTIEERQQLAEEWMRHGPALGIKIYVHVGCDALDNARQLAAHAEHIGATGIVQMPGSYFRPQTVDQLLAELKYVMAAAPSLAGYYYHIPSMSLSGPTKSGFKMTDLIAANEADGHGPVIPNFAGIKFTDYDLMQLNLAHQANGGKYDMVFGRDEILMGALTFGIKGAVGSTYNYIGTQMNQLIDAVNKGDFDSARKIQTMCDHVVLDLLQNPNWSNYNVGKVIGSMISGVELGPPRLPSIPMPEAEKAALRKALQDMGLLPATQA